MNLLLAIAAGIFEHQLEAGYYTSAPGHEFENALYRGGVRVGRAVSALRRQPSPDSAQWHVYRVGRHA